MCVEFAGGMDELLLGKETSRRVFYVSGIV
jgi:hypothetical protein